MRPMMRSVMGVGAGFILASAIMMALESVNGRFLYPELGKLAEGVKDRDALKSILSRAPTGAFFVVILGWVLGSIAGGCMAALIGKRAPVGHALVLGGILALAGIATNLMIPPPLWLWIVGLMVFLPATFAGARLAQRLTTREENNAMGS
jgi:hypothetical protein